MGHFCSSVGRLFILVADWSAVCSKTCHVGLIIRSNAREKSHERFSANAGFSQRNENELTDLHDMFCFNHASAFYTNNNIVKNVDKRRIQGTNCNRKSHRKYALLWVSPRALNMSCSSGQSASSDVTTRKKTVFVFTYGKTHKGDVYKCI